jgi:thioredoxin 1
MSVKVTDASFRNEIQNGLTLVDFWAPWCGPCKMLGPVLEDLEKDFVGKVKIAKVNVDENKLTAGQFGVQSIPTMILFNNGQPVEKIVGFQPKEVLRKFLASKIG